MTIPALRALPLMSLLTIACLLPASRDAAADQPNLVKSAPAAGRILANTQNALFELVAELAAKRPLRVAVLAEILLRPWHEDRSASNPYFSVYRSARRKENIVLEAELRTSREIPKDGPADGFLSLEINSTPCIRSGAVERQFGDNAEFTPPSAHGSQRTPMYLGYRQTWGRLSFGFSRTEPSCLVRVIVDAVKPQPSEDP